MGCSLEYRSSNPENRRGTKRLVGLASNWTDARQRNLLRAGRLPEGYSTCTRHRLNFRPVAWLQISPVKAIRNISRHYRLEEMTPKSLPTRRDVIVEKGRSFQLEPV
ncbi:unnamed protein product [Protopolystoma xenopodis]|uniref:Uncharacterized protein n=1 Tax=Protopolystoma xenopodis TaxID=117903 RepID=A0A3S4ZYA6_9PLAT|nr:unnamed protein product [Protopolystoma xenopodis]